MVEPGSAHILWGLSLTTVAGLATGVGSLIALLAKKTDTRFLSGALGFSAGVMVYISLVELLSSAHAELGRIFGARSGSLWATVVFFGGMALAMLIDRLVPEWENPHEPHSVEDMEDKKQKVSDAQHLFRTGILFALAIAIHNFPEGMATFISAQTAPATGISIAAAIAIHNIPEGLTVAVPIYHATGSKSKAFWLSFASGLAEPLGAAVAALVLMPFLSPALLAFCFAAVAGIMVFVAFDELLPLSEHYGHHHIAISGVIAGMLVMALTLIW